MLARVTRLGLPAWTQADAYPPASSGLRACGQLPSPKVCLSDPLFQECLIFQDFQV